MPPIEIAAYVCGGCVLSAGGLVLIFRSVLPALRVKNGHLYFLILIGSVLLAKVRKNFAYLPVHEVDYIIVMRIALFVSPYHNS